MNSLRIRAVRLNRQNTPDYDKEPYAVVVSQDNAIWWVVSRHYEAKMAIAAAMALESFLRANELSSHSTVLWATKV